MGIRAKRGRKGGFIRFGKRRLILLAIMAISVFFSNGGFEGLKDWVTGKGGNPFSRGGKGGGYSQRGGSQSGGQGEHRKIQKQLDRLEGVRLSKNKRNDGDSFHVKHEGEHYEFRLYFVDTPEKYISKHNSKRVGHQARYFKIELDEAVETGKDAKRYTLDELAGKKFTVHTRWEPVYKSGRYYCFVELDDGDYLSEKLCREGLARIYTKGDTTPDGRKYQAFKKHLKKLEGEARQEERGAWSY